MLGAVLALAALLGLMAGLGVFLYMQQKQAAAGGGVRSDSGEAAGAAAPRVRGWRDVVSSSSRLLVAVEAVGMFRCGFDRTHAGGYRPMAAMAAH